MTLKNIQIGYVYTFQTMTANVYLSLIILYLLIFTEEKKIMYLFLFSAKNIHCDLSLRPCIYFNDYRIV